MEAETKDVLVAEVLMVTIMEAGCKNKTVFAILCKSKVQGTRSRRNSLKVEHDHRSNF